MDKTTPSEHSAAVAKRIAELRTQPVDVGDPFEFSDDEFPPFPSDEQLRNDDDHTLGLPDFHKSERWCRINVALVPVTSYPTTIKVSCKELVVVSGLQSFAEAGAIALDNIWIEDRRTVPADQPIDFSVFARPRPVLLPIGLVSRLVPFMMQFSLAEREPLPVVKFGLFGRTMEQIDRFGVPPGLGSKQSVLRLEE